MSSAPASASAPSTVFKNFLKQMGGVAKIFEQSNTVIARNEESLKKSRDALSSLLGLIQTIRDEIKQIKEEYRQRNEIYLNNKGAFEEQGSLDIEDISPDTIEARKARAYEYLDLLAEQELLYQLVTNVRDLNARKEQLKEDVEGVKAEISRLEEETIDEGDTFIQANIRWILQHAPDAAEFIHRRYPDPKMFELESELRRKNRKCYWMHDRLVWVNYEYLESARVANKAEKEWAEEEKAERKKRTHREMEDLDFDVANGRVVKTRKIARGRRSASVDIF